MGMAMVVVVVVGSVRGEDGYVEKGRMGVDG